MPLTKNYQYNRIESETGHEYLTDFDGIRAFDKHSTEGYIKCKLFHGNGFSLVTPDQIYFGNKELWWIQPLYYGANLIAKTDEYIECKLWVDISFGACLEITFRSSDHVKTLCDGSEIYKCTILGPENLANYSTGRARWKGIGVPQVQLFHHTKGETKSKILKSGHFLPSSWNIQGNKKLSNIKYVYFTCLDRIIFEEDLRQIAMANHGKIGFRLDQNFSNTPDLILEVYRENTLNRNHSIAEWVDSSLLTSQPVYRHSPPGNSVYYEIVQPFTYRVGLKPDTVLKITEDQVEATDKKQLGYIVLGDATTMEGLVAPFDEEETEQILKIEEQSDCKTNLDFWVEQSNKNHFEKIQTENLTFES